jgi:hypothetical protein
MSVSPAWQRKRAVLSRQQVAPPLCIVDMTLTDLLIIGLIYFG